MKNVLVKYLGLLGLVIYCPICVLIRIPVGVFLALVIIFVLIIWNPITGKDSTASWLNRLYDWYCGK